MKYSIMEPEFVLKSFDDMNKKETQQYFDWFMSIREERISKLESYICNVSGYINLDQSPESLIPLWEWFEGQIEWETVSEEELRNEKENYPKWMHVWLEQYDKKESLQTIAIAVDIATYFGDVLIYNNPKIVWGYRCKPKALDGRNQPILIGFKGDVCVNPRRLISVCIKKSSREKNPNRLYQLYQTWCKNI